LLVIAAAAQQLDASLERIELRPLSPALAKTKLVEALGARSWADGLADQLVRETSGHPGELEAALHDSAGRRLLTRRGGRWELDLLLSGPGSPLHPSPSTWAARAAVLAVPEHQRSALGQAAVLWEELDANMLAGEQTHLVAEGLQVAEHAGLRFSQRAVLRAAEGALPLYQRWQAHLRAADLTRDLAARPPSLPGESPGRVRAALAAARDRIRCGARSRQPVSTSLREPASRIPSERSRRPSLRARGRLPRAGRPASRGTPGICPGARARRLSRAQSAEGGPRRAGRRAGSSRCSRRSRARVGRRRSAGGDDRRSARRSDARRVFAGGGAAAAALPLARERGDEEAATRLHHLLGTCACTGVKDGARSPKNARRC